MYKVAASVVVTLEFVAARVGCCNAINAQLVAVPDPAVAESVNVCATTFSVFPVVFGVPDFPPGVKLTAWLELETIEVAPAESKVIVNPANDTAFVRGNATSVPLLRMLPNSLFQR
ncbi:MAG: hypothetical protein L0287_33595, partial [Anaerolineae bacterium]|nr:hypothetical protein [Anaerolineae bacterium]